MFQNHPHHATYVRIGILATALLLTAAFHFLVAGRWYGLGLAIFAILLVIGVHIIDVFAVKPNNTWAYVFLIPLITCAAAESIYDNFVIRGLALAIIILSAALFAYWFTAPRVGFWSAPVLWPATAIKETIWPYTGIGKMSAGFTKTDRLRKIFLGLIIAVPFVIIICILFSQADAIFGKAISEIFNFKNAALNGYKILRDIIVALFLIASGWTIYARVSEERKAKVGASSNIADQTIVTTFLAILNLLFLAFIVVQAIAFFGGDKFVVAQGITYANYARNGFFQLLAVAGIVFIIMIAVYRYTHLQQWGSRALSMALIVETGVVIVSAIRRLLLYIDTYGLTPSRYWAMVVIIVIAVVLLSLLVGALAKIKYEPIIRSIFVGLLILVPMLFLFNINAYIVKFNLDRFLSGQTDQFDSGYFSSIMSSDSVPVLVGALRSGWPASEKVNIFAKSTLYSALSYKMDKLQKSIDTDWRDAVISDYRALAALGALKEIDPATLVPEKITGNFDASQNYATNFGGTEYLFPKEIDGNLTISADIAKLTKFFPNRVTGDVVVIIGTGYINAKSLNLPIQNIGGSLILRGAVNNFIAMPKNIGKDLDLSGLSATTPIPVGINIGGSILISKPNMQNADMIIGDAQSKGYRVTVSEVPAGFAPGPCGSEENPCPRPSF